MDVGEPKVEGLQEQRQPAHDRRGSEDAGEGRGNPFARAPGLLSNRYASLQRAVCRVLGLAELVDRLKSWPESPYAEWREGILHDAEEMVRDALHASQASGPPPG